MSNPRRFWGSLVGGFAILFGVVDIACARGPANGDTFSEVLAGHLNTPTKRAAFIAGWAALACWFPKHILKDRA